MPQVIGILGLPFLACLLMGTILGYLGIHVLKREVIFIDIALAQIAAVGSIVAHLMFEAHGDSLLAYICSFVCILFAALFYAVIRNRVFEISLEAIIGISYALAAGGILFLVGIAPGGHVHIHDILSGSLLWTSRGQIITALIVFGAIGLFFLLLRKQMIRISDSYKNDLYELSKSVVWDFVFYLLVGIVIMVSVQMGGVVVVFAYLIIPATISAVISSRIVLQLAVIWAVSICASVMGLLFAYYFDFSIGPSISLFLGGELILVSLVVMFIQRSLSSVNRQPINPIRNQQ